MKIEVISEVIIDIYHIKTYRSDAMMRTEVGQLLGILQISDLGAPSDDQYVAVTYVTVDPVR